MTVMSVGRMAVAALAVAGCCGVAVAQQADQQTRNAPPAPMATDPQACAPGERLTNKDLRPDTALAPGETLSDKLNRTDGVLCPPPIDRGMAERPPQGGTMRVIPPPGSPGGNPNVQPK